jgi:hypothetical protein
MAAKTSSAIGSAENGENMKMTASENRNNGGENGGGGTQ